MYEDKILITYMPSQPSLTESLFGTKVEKRWGILGRRARLNWFPENPSDLFSDIHPFCC